MKTLKINHLAILVIVILGQLIPFGWYTIFAEKWMSLNGLTTEEIESQMSATPYISSIITSIVFAYVFAWLFKRLSIKSASEGLKTALIIWLPFSLLNHITVNLFSFRPYALSWIDAGSDFLIYAAIGLILGGWRKYEEDVTTG